MPNDKMNATVAAHDEHLIIASATLAGDLRDFLLDRLKNEKSSLPWNVRSETEQNEVIARTTDVSMRWAEKAVRMIAASGRKTIQATLTQVTVKDGIKAQFELSKADPMRHELVDAQGSTVLLVVAGAEEFQGTRGDVAVTKDQASLGEEYDNQ